MGHYREYPPPPASTVMGFRLNKHSFSCVSFLSCVHSRTKKYKFLETRVLRKRTFSRTLSKGRCFYIMMDKRQTKVKVLMSQLFIDDMFTTLKWREETTVSLAPLKQAYVVRNENLSIVGYAFWGAQRGLQKTMRKRKNEKRRYQYVFANSKTTRYRMWPEKQLVYQPL